LNELERAIVRACLAQVTEALAEARGVRTWWETLAREHRRVYQEFEMLVGYFRRDDSLD